MLRLILPLLCCLPILLTAQEDLTERNLLSSQWNAPALAEVLLPASAWHHFPPTTDRAAWEGLPEEVKSTIIEQGEAALDYEWPRLPASLYLEFTRNGNRSNYQGVYFERRARLAELVVAEALTQEGRYLDQAINGVWAIAEESTWCIPAHLGLQANGHSGLPDQQGEVVDLFAAETGTTLAWTYYFLHEQFEEVTPAINSRIKAEIQERILHPLLARIDFWWMGLGARRNVNNWNPWVISNWLTTALLIETDPALRARHVGKAMVCLDKFINQQPEDGGCDEGPGYWGRAGASLFDCLDLMYSASEGAIDIFDQPLIRKTGTYITKAYIKQPYYINFADASAKTTPDPVIVYRYGKAVEDEGMIGFGGFLQEQNGINLDGAYSFGRMLNRIFYYQEVLDAPVAEPMPQDVWLPDLEVYAARDQAGTADGFYLAGKGGHNAESHNHNDVGNFILFYDGLPAIIDVGVEEYSRKTFSGERYTIWTMQSQYHTLPTINGVMQVPGREYEAQDVQYSADEEQMTFSLDIAGAYPDSAGVERWVRTVSLQRGEAVEVTEDYSLEEASGPTSLFFMTPCIPDAGQEGRVRLSERGGAFQLDLFYDADVLEVHTEAIAVEDRRLQPVWGDEVHRIELRLMDPEREGEIAYSFRPVGE